MTRVYVCLRVYVEMVTRHRGSSSRLNIAKQMNLTPPHSSNVSNGEMRDDYRITASPNMFFGRINDGKPTSPLLPTIFPSLSDGSPRGPMAFRQGLPTGTGSLQQLQKKSVLVGHPPRVEPAAHQLKILRLMGISWDLWSTIWLLGCAGSAHMHGASGISASKTDMILWIMEMGLYAKYRMPQLIAEWWPISRENHVMSDMPLKTENFRTKKEHEDLKISDPNGGAGLGSRTWDRPES